MQGLYEIRPPYCKVCKAGYQKVLFGYTTKEDALQYMNSYHSISRTDGRVQ